MVLTKNPDRCLTLFPRPAWERFRPKLVALPESRNWIKRLYMGSESPVQLDSSSRVLVPPELREWAGLERDVIFMGTGVCFELWDKARYAAFEDKALEQEKKSEQLDDLSVQ
jgi:MraZ protein